ncbi:hypothetical protein AGMMS49545_05980 [Betaproteobacteria bacterium]|nr:hypothetical protein AGMMS49545_05980 [Betaproteobacteria bacterium]GHU44227.1 hypothetical protein AGMMS50289_12060 [Betaproteobacteria bacterium]
MQAPTLANTLLLVDEETGVLNALCHLLGQGGYNILSADSGKAGLRILREQTVDVILSEQHMSGMSGDEFLHQAKILQPDSVRMLLTGDQEIQSVARTVNKGSVYKFLTKPWNDEQLRATVAEAFVYKGLCDHNRHLAQTLAETNQKLFENNQHLQQLLEEKQYRIQLGEKVVKVLHEVTQLVPLPLLGVDDNGMVASANEAAQKLFGAHALLLGGQISTLLSPKLLQHIMQNEGDEKDVDIPPFIAADGKLYNLRCRTLGLRSQASGKLIIFMPQNND